MFSSCPVTALVAGVKIGSGKAVRLAQTLRQFDAANLARGFVFLPCRTGNIATDDAFDREHLRPLHQHGTAAQLIGIFAKRRRILGHVRRDQMVGEQCLKGNRTRRVKSGSGRGLSAECPWPARSQTLKCGRWRRTAGVVVNFVNIAYLAAGMEIEIGKIGAKQDGVESVCAHIGILQAGIEGYSSVSKYFVNDFCAGYAGRYARSFSSARWEKVDSRAASVEAATDKGFRQVALWKS